MDIKRRQLLHGSAAGAGLLALGGSAGCAPPPATQFHHGVASGDPTDTNFIIWTRVSVAEPGDMPVQWVVARDEDLRDVVTRGQAVARPLHDYCVKVDVRLPATEEPGRHYYYGFITHDQLSPIGRTRTFPSSGVAETSLAVVSCANYPSGFFHVYRELSQRDDIAAVIHLGDYIYEYGGPKGYDADIGREINRVVEPPYEISTLQDYRRRYAQYRSDADLQAAHARHPFIVVWDDHESANDSWNQGAQNHSEETEGPWSMRVAAAIQAYSEWMPIRLPEPDNLLRIYRDFRIGDLVHLHMLDTRLIGRDRQLSYIDFRGDKGFDAAGLRKALSDPKRQLLGANQFSWLQDNLAASNAVWQVMGQQILMSRIKIPKVDDLIGDKVLPDYVERLKAVTDSGLAYNLDAWDGYPAARERLYAEVLKKNQSLISLAGDTHNAWASNLYNQRAQQVGAEFAVASVCSPGVDDLFHFTKPKEMERRMLRYNQGLQFFNARNRGYMTLQLNSERALAEYVFVSDVKQPNYEVLDRETHRLEFRSVPGSALLSA